MRQLAKMPAAAVAQFLAYDPLTGHLTWLPRGNPSWDSRYAGTVAGTKKRGEIQVSVKWAGEQRLYRAHHLAWAIMTEEWPDDEIDHEDGNPHNNAWLNLRLATSTQNNCNRKPVVGTCPYRGVYFHAARERFAAQIKVDGDWSWLGLHDTPELAAQAYDAAAMRLHGEFAVTNQSLGLLEQQHA